MNKAGRVADYVATSCRRWRASSDTVWSGRDRFRSQRTDPRRRHRNLEVIGEAANNIQRVDPAFTAAHPEVVERDLPSLRQKVASIQF
ncbi:hypothetical protein [Hydrogenophaga pseudoflava]|uniref:hypothetical protein n=1 Tax=Hydrogenophaga pseudoflava TaxID=47421 RepID=UPI0027E537A9|nr:hypothetical protein [Hydrogenophaga pseudoflava]MDQ7743213.1 hypothetical protein [Hydrogenophaga pseudoflava]